MIVIAIFGTICALGWTLMVFMANGMRSSPGDFVGRFGITVAWTIAAVLWLGWYFK